MVAKIEILLLVFLQNLKSFIVKGFWILCSIAFLLMSPIKTSGAETDFNSNFVMDIPRQDETLGPWSELLLYHSLTDYCGLQDWYVRQGYQILRKEYVKGWPISFTRLQALRADVVDWSEAVLVGQGLENFNSLCGVDGEKAAMFFVNAWAKENTPLSVSKIQH